MEVTNKELVSAGKLKPNFSATTIMQPIRYKQFNKSLVAVYITSGLREEIEARIVRNMNQHNRDKMMKSLVPVIKAIDKIEKGK
jgi:hypothetical protein